MLEVIKDKVHNSRKRFLEVRPNGAGLWIGMDTYQALKDTKDYTESMKIIVPVMEGDTATITNNTNATTGVVESHTVTCGTGFEITADMVADAADYAIVLYSKAALKAFADVGDFKSMANPRFVSIFDIDLTATPLTAGTQTVFQTVGASEYSADYTDAMILKNNGYLDVAQITDFGDSEAADSIPTDNKHSGGYKSSIPGLKSSNVESTTGFYDPSFPSIASISYAADGDFSLQMRTGAIKKKFAPYKTGSYKVSEFTTSGATDGSNALQYSASFELQSGTIEKKTWI